MNYLEMLRREIDECDKEIVKNYEKRMEAVLKVMEYKRQERLPIFQSEREKQVIDKVVEGLKNKGFKEESILLYKEIMRISRKRQSKELFPYNIILIGFMGTGKSSISQQLSQMLEMPWVDTDLLIETKTNLTIQKIFEAKGEEGFRKIETQILKEVVKTKDNYIISCGGGLPLKKENVNLLRSKGRILLLDASPETIYQRLETDTTRPLLKGNISVEYIKEMLEKRKDAYYNACDYVIKVDNRKIEDIAMDIINRLLE